jgi:hypothetical protein
MRGSISLQRLSSATLEAICSNEQVQPTTLGPTARMMSAMQSSHRPANEAACRNSGSLSSAVSGGAWLPNAGALKTCSRRKRFLRSCECSFSPIIAAKMTLP